MWYWYEGMGWWMVGMGIAMLLFWGGLIALIVWAVVRATRGGRETGAGGKPSPLDIARERYARGEISKEQFEQIKKDLSS